jgi:hypothetical protein
MPASYTIEIVTATLKPGVTREQITAADARVGAEHIAQQPGFLSREVAYDEDHHSWLAIVRWATEADANASMRSFLGVAISSLLTDLIQAETMQMKRYSAEPLQH